MTCLDLSAPKALLTQQRYDLSALKALLTQQMYDLFALKALLTQQKYDLFALKAQLTDHFLDREEARGCPAALNVGDLVLEYVQELWGLVRLLLAVRAALCPEVVAQVHRVNRCARLLVQLGTATRALELHLL